MRVELKVDVGEVYAKGEVVEVCRDYMSQWDYELGEIDIRLEDESIYPLQVGEYKFV